MPKYSVCTPIKHDGKKYAVGASIDLTKAEAEALPDGTVELPRADDASARKAAQKAEAERVAAEKAEAERLAQEEAEAAQRAEAERLAAEQAGSANGGAQG